MCFFSMLLTAGRVVNRFQALRYALAPLLGPRIVDADDSERDIWAGRESSGSQRRISSCERSWSYR